MATWAAIFITALSIGLFVAVTAAVIVPIGLGIAKAACTRSQVYGERNAFVRRIALITSLVVAILAGTGAWVGLMAFLNTRVTG